LFRVREELSGTQMKAHFLGQNFTQNFFYNKKITFGVKNAFFWRTKIIAVYKFFGIKSYFGKK